MRQTLVAGNVLIRLFRPALRVVIVVDRRSGDVVVSSHDSKGRCADGSPARSVARDEPPSALVSKGLGS